MIATRLARYADDVRTLPSDMALAWRNDGASAVWDAVADRSVRRAVRWGRFVVIAQTLDRVREVPPPAGVGIRAAAPADRTALLAIVPRREQARLTRLGEPGRACLVAWRRRQPVGYTWFAERLAPDVSLLPLPLPADAAYLYDLFVSREERGSGVGSALASARMAHARRLGFREGWRMIAPANRASFRTVEKTAGSGTRIIGEIGFLKVGPRVMARWRVR